MLESVRKALELSYQAELVLRRTERETPLTPPKADRIREGLSALSEQQTILKGLIDGASEH